MTFSFSELLMYLGGVLGLILSIVIWAKMKGEKYIKLSLSLYLTVTSIAVILGALNYSGKTHWLPHLLRLDSPIHYLYGPIGLFYVSSILIPGFRFKWIYLIHLTPFLYNLIDFLPFYLSSADDKLIYYHQVLSSGSYVMPFHYLLKTILYTFYLIWQFIIFLRYRRNLAGRTNTGTLKIWLSIFLTCQAVFVTGIVTDNILGQRLLNDPYQFSMIMATVMLLSTSIALLFFPSLLYGNLIVVAETGKPKYHNSRLTSEQKEEILNRLAHYLNSGEKSFRNSGLNLATVSKALDINSSQLSQVVNEKTGKNFNDYINSYRIEESKRILVSGEFRNLTIDAIASKAGFQSRAPFYKAFKEQTGMTPRQFIEENGKNAG